MKQQVVTIHGGTTFDTHKDYISYLKNKTITLDKLITKKYWKDTLQDKLGSDYEVLSPRMPNGTNAKYSEWKIWFERIIPLLSSNVIIIGHSLGGIFLAKYLSQHTCPKTIKAVVLVAAPFDDTDSEESLADFKLPSSLNKFSSQVAKIYVLHSKDDPVVLFNQQGDYLKALPKAIPVIFNDKEHFNDETFPEIIKLIKSV